MSIFFGWFLNTHVLLSGQSSTVKLLKTRWDIANTPIVQGITLYCFPRRLVFFVGQSSSGKTWMVKVFQKRFPNIKIHSEFARSIMQKEGWTRNDIEDQSIGTELQKQLCLMHSELLKRYASGEEYPFAVVDRSVLDALFYLHLLYPGNTDFSQYVSQEVFSILKKQVIIFFPFHSQFATDDGVRKMPKAVDDILWQDILKPFKHHKLQSFEEEARFEEIMTVIRATS